MSTDLRLEVSVDDQQMRVFLGTDLVRTYIISTATKGVGFQPGSFRTPTGNFRIADKIGNGAPSGTIFKSREAEGVWTTDSPPTCDDLILTRILRIAGLDPENANSYDRYIYIHGTNREDLLGQPNSHGCIRMGNADVIELFDLVEPGVPMVITPPAKNRGKLFFFDCDSTLSTIEGIDELARVRGEKVYEDVVALTNAAMNGEIPLTDVFPQRMEIIQPDRATCEAVARLYIETITPGVPELVERLKAEGWTVVILSGGFAPLIEPLARELGIDHVEAVPLHLDPEGRYTGYGSDYPTTRNGGKNEIIREWKSALRPNKTVMMGDGVSDLETKPDVDLFVGFGGVARRPLVMKGASIWVEQMSDFETDRL